MYKTSELENIKLETVLSQMSKLQNLVGKIYTIDDQS